MYKAKRVGFHVLLALALWSCAPWRPFPPPIPSPSRNWSVVLIQSGGFAGASMTVAVESDGEIKAQNARRGSEISRQLSEADLTELERLLAIANVIGPAEAPSTCADCFLLDLKITGPGPTVHWRGDDTTLDSSGLGDLIRFLVRLRDEALAGAI